MTKLSTLWSIKDKLFAIILSIVVLGVYTNSIANQYGLDDDITIFKNLEIAKGIKGIPTIITQPYLDVYHGASYGYRPISAISFAIEHSLWGFNPHISHFVNIILYIANILVLFVFFLRLLPNVNRYFIYAGILLFALHPIHTEVVNNLKSRDILFAFLFGVWAITLALNLLVANPQKIKILITSTLLYIVACLAHPMSILFAAIWLLVLLFKQPITTLLQGKNIVATFLIILFVASFKIVDLYTDFISQGYKVDTNFLWENPLYVFHDTDKMIGLSFNSLLFYLKQLLIPYPLAYYYGYNQIPYQSWQNTLPLLSILLYTTILLGGIWGILKQKLIGFLLLLYFACIFPFSNLLQIGPGIVAERWTYLASVPISMIVAYMVFKLFKTDTYQLQTNKLPAIPIAIIGMVATVFAIVVIQRNPNWYNTTTLAAHDIAYLPNSAKANSFLAEEMMKTYLLEAENNPDKHTAIEGLFLNALKIDSTYAEVWNNLGVMNFRKGDTITAQICYEQALKYKQPYYLAMSNLADIYNKKGDFNKAIQLYTDYIQQDSSQINAFLNLARFQSATKQLDVALKTNQVALQLFPKQSAIIYDNNAVILYENDLKEEAYKNWQLALQKDPNNEKLQYKINNIKKDIDINK
ncbi:MAG: tetratricopeptide repeat protein [Chitinophagales bacterium]|nr:tetratricopeptide repeat protein [Chitinophagales bacterium]